MPRAVYAGVIYWLCFLWLVVWALHRGLSDPTVQRGPDESAQTPQIKTEAKSYSAGEGQKQREKEMRSPPEPAATARQRLASVGDEKRQGDAHKSEEEGSEFWPPFFGYRVKITDSLLSIFTFGLFIATWFLFRATRDLVRGADQTAQRQLRAYLSVGQIVVIKVRDKSPAEWQLAVFWVNTGNTPAQNVRMWISVVTRTALLPALFNFNSFESETRPGGFIPPRGTIRSRADQVFTDNDLIEIRDERAFMYLTGAIMYDDIFTETPKRMTRFCQRITFSGDISGSGIGGEGVEANWTPHEWGNCADEECERQDRQSISS